MRSTEDPAWFQQLQKDASPFRPLCSPQDGSLGTGGPVMRDCCSSPKAIPTPPKHTLDHSLGMDSRYSSPSGAGEGASCSESSAGSLACLSPTCNPLPETVREHGALITGTSEKTAVGKPEPVPSADNPPTAPENRNPVFLEKMESISLKQADSTSPGKEEAGPLRKGESVLMGEVEPAICGKGEPGAVGRMDCTAPRKEDSVSLERVDPVCSSKVDTATPGGGNPGSSGKVDPRKEDPTYSGRENLGSTGKGDLVSLGEKEMEPPEKTDPASTKKTDSGFSEKPTPGSSSKTELGSSGTVTPGTKKVNPVCLGMVDPAAVGNTETLSSAKEGPPSSGEGGPMSVRMAKTGPAGRPEGVFSPKTDPTSVNSTGPPGSVDPDSLRDVELVSSVKPEILSSGQAERVSLVKTETLSSGREDPRSSRRVDHTTVTGTIKTSQKGNPESLGKTDPVSSSSADAKSLGAWGSVPASKTEAETEGKGGPLSLEKASPTASEKAEPLAFRKAGSANQGKAETVPSEEVGSTTAGKVVPTASGKLGLVSPGKVDPMATERAEGIPEAKAPERRNPVNSASASGSAEPKPGVKVVTPLPGASSPGKVEAPSSQEGQPRVSGKMDPSGKVDPTVSVEPVSLGKAESACPSPLSPEKATSSGGTPCGAAQPLGAAGSRGALPEPEPAASPGHTDLAAAAERSAAPPGPRTRDNFTKAPSWDAGRGRGGAAPPREDAGTQAGARACVSVAVSPMSPQDGAAGPAFSFQAAAAASTARAPSPAPGPPSRRDAGLQVSLGAAETRSVATGPMTPQAAAPPAAPPVFPEVRVRPGSVLAAAMAPQEAAEPVRDVSWDEKGMTWEVYGASMEVEVLGMAIQKHLERQIEEHGRQGAPAPPPAVRAGPGRAGSVRAAPADGAAKRPPGLFRALLQSVRRPRCCSRAGPTAE
ncbi:LOW QUALITY PROTEIN: G protein-regulated inducer of neurite outgrowth 1 isoform X2 [Cricetulus griseus]|uniref:LOW QUALITY PROTEIN: G protein-regulated inducer of neurite outgrowth 1 isoform X2 n=1 Tax=Cricetulus griseus TaxID=10029 RepID=A0A9J7GTJ1_CRIGR|nr:LOW QUALITY PROTEIN: G protein-regulated inducer of neurite outgrowth 1 isoform X2 [Cricetulus griseus]